MKLPRTHQAGLLEKRLRLREQQALDIVTQEPGLGAAEIAERMGIQSTTAGNYMNCLSTIRLVHCTGFGRWATWWPGEAPKPTQIARTPMGPNSVWNMA